MSFIWNSTKILFVCHVDVDQSLFSSRAARTHTMTISMLLVLISRDLLNKTEQKDDGKWTMATGFITLATIPLRVAAFWVMASPFACIKLIEISRPLLTHTHRNETDTKIYVRLVYFQHMYYM